MSEMPAAPLTLHTYKLPRNMSPSSATDVAMALTGHRRVSDLVRYLAMALHYASWTLDESSLSEYEVLISGMSPETGNQLLEALSFQVTFAMRGEHDSLPPALVRRSQSAAKEWRRALTAKDLDALRLHRRAIELLERTLSSAEDAQRMLVAELQVAVMARSTTAAEAPDTLAPANTAQPPYAVADAHPRRGAPPMPMRGVRVFAGPAEALAFLMHQMGATLPMGMPHPTLMQPGSDPTDAHASAPSVAPAAAPEKPPAPLKGARLRVFTPGEAFGVLQRMPPPAPHEGNNQQRRILETMAADLGVRSLTETPQGNPLAELYESFPHFRKVLDFVARSLALAGCGEGGRPARIPPILLRSEPGIGKTYFAQELARVLGAHFVERDLAVVSEAWVISGMDSSWKGSKPGIVFDALVNGKTANPVISLNEVDKAKLTGAHISPLAALYSLLEPTSAERFQDEFVPVPLNASGIIWVLTANDGNIPEPILSRVEEFDIPRPTQDECRAIAASVWRSICAKTLPAGHQFAPELPAEVLNAVSALSPRLMRRTLTKAVGEAAFWGRHALQRSDLDAASASGAAPARSIGFLA